jgi:hypothetical protein
MSTYHASLKEYVGKIPDLNIPVRRSRQKLEDDIIIDVEDFIK